MLEMKVTFTKLPAVHLFWDLINPQQPLLANKNHQQPLLANKPLTVSLLISLTLLNKANVGCLLLSRLCCSLLTQLPITCLQRSSPWCGGSGSGRLCGGWCARYGRWGGSRSWCGCFLKNRLLADKGCCNLLCCSNKHQVPFRIKGWDGHTIHDIFPKCTLKGFSTNITKHTHVLM